ncbi:MAG TPA: hypothetical protein VK674_06120 [Candidatus Limnocylindria bacterium]|nr:hypothetical protein [Candidatus Limnocylindria bacterium]
MIEYRFNESGLIDECSLSLTELYSDDSSREAFIGRFERLSVADPTIAQIAKVEDDEFRYRSESYIPPTIDPDKKTLVMVLGNPAPESVAMDAMFAYESNGARYHRFWKVLDSVGVLQFPQGPDELEPHEKMEKLYNNDYLSPFNLHILPFYSFPTAPGGEWSGVAGVRRLFADAFPDMETRDSSRMLEFLDQRLHDGDFVLAFQKDAYNALSKSQAEPVPYNYRGLLAQPAVSTFQTPSGETATLICMLPTRLLHSHQTKETLSRLALGEALE